MENAIVRSRLGSIDRSVQGGTASFEKINLDGLAVMRGEDGSVLALILRDQALEDEAEITDAGRFRSVTGGSIAIKYPWG